MPFNEITIIPTVQIETTDSDNPSGVSESNFIRWKGGLIEKRGGCTLYINAKLEGIPNDLQPWIDITQDYYLSVSTDAQVYNYNSSTSALAIISPQYIESPSVPPNLSTTENSSLVTVTDATKDNVTVYDSVTFNVPVTVGGLILQNTYTIVEATGSNTYVIDAQELALSTASSTGTVPVFTTQAGSAVVKITFPTQYQGGTPHSLAVGDRIGFLLETVVGGLTVVGQYLIDSIIDENNYTIVASKLADSTATASMNNGNMDLTYWITNGPRATGSGYGAFEYGQYEYGRGKKLNPLSGKTYTADNWYLDSRGALLVAAAVKKPVAPQTWVPSPIFYWNDSYGFTNLAILQGSPIVTDGAFVSMPYGHIMAWGCSEVINPFGDPLHIRWSSATDPNTWTIAGNSDAGFYNIPTGSKIVRGIQGATQQYWFTDVDVYTAQYVGYPGTYGFNKIGGGCGLVAPKAVGLLNGSLYWMSQRQFFVCPQGSSPQPIPCSVWDFIFQNSTDAELEHVICGTNALFNEVNWFFPVRGDDGNPDTYLGKPVAYVSYNTQYNLWDVGYLNRTAWYDQSALGPPLATDSDGYVYQHETSSNLAVGNSTQPIDAWFKTGYYSLTSGQDLTFVDWVIPDMKWAKYGNPPTANLKMTLYSVDYPGQTPREYGPYAFNKDTKFINPRLRGRYVAFKIESDDLNSFWRIGSIRYRFAQCGRR